MKKLIFPLILLSLPALAEVQEIPEVSDTDIKNTFMSRLKDAEVEKHLGASSEFNDCRTKYKFEAKDQKSDREQKLKDATKCFKEKLDKKDPEALKKIAEQLQLQNYGLIKSKSTVEISGYFSKKITKALTGRDPDDKSIDSLKWENQKIVDQKVFIDLYTTQLAKSALYEVSRYCFENLRTNDANNKLKDNFGEHWAHITKTSVPTDKDVNDLGEPKFVKNFDKVDFSKQEEVYSKITAGLGSTIDTDLYANYFSYCQKALPLLCAKFREDSKKTTGEKATDQDSINGKMSPGAMSCLTLDKLQSIRKALKNSEKVAQQFKEMGDDKDKFAIQMIKNPKLYEGGKGDGEDSLDEITTMTSNDMLHNSNNDLSDLEEKCKQDSSSEECKQFYLVGDDVGQAIHNVEHEMTLKKTVEVEKVKKMKGNKEEIDKYLEENGYFDLLNQAKSDPSIYDRLDGEIEKLFDARRVAEVEALKLKVGKRQVSQDDYDAAEKNKTISGKIEENIKESKEERARMAQVVMFNNIITSQLKLEEKGTKKEIGRNVTGWKKEFEGLQGSGINTALFDNLKATVKEHGNTNMDNTSVSGAEILDAILGKQEDPKKKP